MPLALLDMDGTVVDYDSAMKKAMDELRGPDEPEYASFSSRDQPWMEARRRLISKQPGFWENLPRHTPGFEILDMLTFLEFDVMVLTKGPSSKTIAWGEKVEWCRKNLPKTVEVTITENKRFTFGRVLVDDWPEYFEPWLLHRPRGIVVCPAHPWNVGVELRHPNNVFRYESTEQHLQTLKRILFAVKERKDGEAIDLQKIVAM